MIEKYTGELCIADCSCGWSRDLIVYHDDAGRFTGWCYAEGDGEVHGPHHMQVFEGVGKTRRAACIHLQCPECGNEFSILIDEATEKPEMQDAYYNEEIGPLLPPEVARFMGFNVFDLLAGDPSAWAAALRFLPAAFLLEVGEGEERRQVVGLPAGNEEGEPCADS